MNVILKFDSHYTSPYGERQKLALKNFKIYWEERKYVYIYPYII